MAGKAFLKEYLYLHLYLTEAFFLKDPTVVKSESFFNI